jgi:regulator of RNase E activity RraA
MTPYPFTLADLEALSLWDTTTICNGLELIVPERRALGFTVEPMAVLHPDATPIVGLARTGTIRAKEPPRGAVVDRLDWYDYVANASLPTIVVLQDVDDRPGYGAFWGGEVHTNVHLKLGAVGCVTNGSFRDLAASAKEFQIIGGRVGPSHAHIHVVNFGEPVNIFGMQATHDDVIHADCHGAVVIPADCVTKLPAAIDLIARREKVILDLCASPNFSPAKLRETVMKSREIH